MSKMQLEEYYNTAYSKCNLSESFMASWKGVAYPNHVFQIIELPFQILAFYVIISRTPQCMKSMKIPLIVNHMFCVLLAISFCSLSPLYLIPPMYGAFSVGLLSWMEIPFINQMVLTGIFGVGASCSYTYLFETRSSSIFQNPFRISRRRTKFLYYLIVFLPYLCIVFFFFGIPEDQETAKLNALQKYPCPPIEFFTFPVLIVISDEDVINITNRVIIPFAGIHVLSHNLFHISCLIYYLYISPPKTLSAETRRSQKRFLIGITFQCAIPSLFGVIPVLIIFIACRMGNHSQELVNYMVNCGGLHGLGESLSILLVHRPYRKFLLRTICNWKPKKSTTSIQISPGQWSGH